MFSTPPIGLGIAPPARDASNASIGTLICASVACVPNPSVPLTIPQPAPCKAEEITLGSGSGKIGGGTDGRTDSREARRRRRGRSAKDTASSTNGSARKCVVGFWVAFFALWQGHRLLTRFCQCARLAWTSANAVNRVDRSIERWGM